MLLLIVITLLCLVISFIFDHRKTLQGIRKGAIMFLSMLPTLLWVLIIVSLAFYFISEETIVKHLGNGASDAKAYSAAILFGSISLIPGFIAYPLCGLLIGKGVSYSIIAAFITTLMMVGILTLPIEAKFFGWKTSLLRNGLSLVAAVIIGLIMSTLL
ncbi:MAG: permease [Bacteroidales bacterium]